MHLSGLFAMFLPLAPLFRHDSLYDRLPIYEEIMVVPQGKGDFGLLIALCHGGNRYLAMTPINHVFQDCHGALQECDESRSVIISHNII